MNKYESKSFLEWKESHFPDLSKQEKYETLKENSEQLAIVLANDTFDRLHKPKKKNLTKS